jgi:uncharacterized repeat protein (TIGR01451 family)
VSARRNTLGAVLLLLGAGLLGWQGGAVAQRPDRPWQPTPDGPAIIAQTQSKQAPPAHALDTVAALLPATGQELLPVIASTKGPSRPVQPPAPAPIVRVSATDGLAPPAPSAGGTPAPPAPLPALEKRPSTALERPAPPAEHKGSLDSSAAGGVSQAAAVSVETIGPASASVSKPYTFEIVVRNPGSTPAQFVRVQDRLPENLQYLGSEPRGEMHDGQLLWDLGTLDGGAERRIKVSVQATGEGELLTTATATCSARTSLRTKVSQPKLSLVKKGPETAQVGDTVKFELLVSNVGTAPAEQIVLRDRMPAGLQHKSQRTPGEVIEADLGTLAPGQTKTIDMEAKATQAGRFVNEASISAPGIAEVSAQATVVVTDAPLSLRKTGPQRSQPNQELVYELVVTNTGSGAAGGVKLVDTLPEGLDFVSASDSGTYSAATRTVQWELATLGGGQSKAVNVRVKAVKAGEWTNQAVARSERGQETRADLHVQLEGVPALLFEVVDLDDPVEVGSETTYEIRVVNQGTAPCTNVKITCVGPDGLKILGAEAPVAHRQDGNRIVFEPLPKLAAKADVLYKVRARAMKAGDWRFRTLLSSDHMPDPVYEDESTQVYNDNEEAPPTQQDINKRQ